MKIGIDLGGTTVSAGLVNDGMEIVEKTEQLSCCEDGAEAVMSRMADMIEALIKKAGQHPVSCIGLGCPGIMDRESGTVIYSNNIGWEQVPVGQNLKERFRLPVYVENDANCAAAGEYLAGAGRGCSPMVMVTLGTGVGGGVLIDGKLYLGKHGNASIFGHILMEKNGRRCTCQRMGCWESYASAKALLEMAKKEGVFEGMEEKASGPIFFEKLKKKEERARQVFDKYTDFVAEGIADLINIFDPQCVVIGGGISAQGNLLVSSIKNKVKEKIFFSEMDTAQILCSLLANDAAIIGAANLPLVRRQTIQHKAKYMDLP